MSDGAPTHFRLDVDPDGIGLFARALHGLAEDLDRAGARARRVPERPAVEAWQGDAAVAIKPEMVALGTLLVRCGTELGSVVEAAGELERVARSALAVLPRLDRAWERAAADQASALRAADAARTEAVREATRGGNPLDLADEVRINRLHGAAASRALSARTGREQAINAEFAALREQVAGKARLLGAALVSHTPLEVPGVAIEELRRHGTLPTYAFDASGLLGGLAVTRDYLDETDPTAEIELALREEGLLTGPPPSGYYLQWLENAARRGVPVETVVAIARTHDITAEDFVVLDDLEEIRDPDGKSFFLIPDDLSGDDARRAVLMTYILNAGTDYGAASGSNGTANDFPETPYSAEEVQRIIDRQTANDWSYDEDVGFVHGNGGRLVTTPNGILMGLGGSWVQDLYSQQGGTAWGDIFMLNVDDPDDAADALRQVVESGQATYVDDDGELFQTALDLDRLLHHEERHSRQWASEGYAGFLSSYAWERLTGGNETEEDAGLADGGYH